MKLETIIEKAEFDEVEDSVHDASRAFESGGSIARCTIKFDFQDDISIIDDIPVTADYDFLMDKIRHTIRSHSIHLDLNHPIQVKYQDEDGDMVSVRANEDVQMLYEQHRLQTPIIIRVTQARTDDDLAQPIDRRRAKI
jgi:hypothetical protein